MSVTVKKINLWRGEFKDQSGVLADVLGPMSESGSDLHVVMGYRYPGDSSRAAIELYPVSGRKSSRAAKKAGLHASKIPTLLVEGRNRKGLGFELAKAIADRGINMTFLVTQVVGTKYSSIFGFESEADARKATSIIKKVGGPKKK